MTRPLSRTRSTAEILLTLLETATPPASLAARLQQAVRRLVLEGHAPGGARLPSSRMLAKQARLARETVDAAYHQLELEGFVVRRQGSGTFVAPRDAAPAGPNGRARAKGRGIAGLSERGQLLTAGGGIIDHGRPVPFTLLPDVEIFPLQTWQRIAARAVRARSRTDLLYAEAQGYLPLREEIAHYLAACRGIVASPGQILVLSSSQQALSLIAKLVASAGDLIAIEDPGYHGAQMAFRGAGTMLLPISVDQEGLSVEQLAKAEARVRAAYVTPSNQYPLGVTMSLDRRLALLDWSERNGSWIVEDDYDSEFRYDGRPIAALQSLNARANVLYVGTMTKVLFPGLRIAYLVVPEHLAAAFVTGRSLIDGSAAKLNQVVLADFMREGHFTAHTRRMRQIYQARRDRFVAAFNRHLGAFAACNVPRAGLHVTAMLKSALDEAATLAVAERSGIALRGLGRLALGSAPTGGWLMGFASRPPQDMEDAMMHFANALRLSV
ncbi:PLP-dependent aminotransferase family protein [Bosea sp. RAF48]|uniref:MocR-like pyridoxine biosynthesis transcription factor PdxR n=1 Tax=Bosea sp. RAF48 TaxID=3237480 RepID=UPI003F91770B